MYKQLTKLMIVTSFGKGSNRPLRKATSLLIGASIMFLAIGIATYRLIDKASIAGGLPEPVQFNLIAMLTFILVGFILLPIANFLDSRQSIVSNNLKIWPLRRMVMWFVRMMPLLIIAILVTELLGPILVGISHAATGSLRLIVAGYLFGLLAALGIAVASLFRTALIKYICYVGLCLSQTYAIERQLKGFGTTAGLVASIFLIGTLVVCSLGIVQRFFIGTRSTTAENSINSTVSAPPEITKRGWFVLKFLRNRKSLSSFAFCLVVSLTILISSQLRHNNLVPAPAAIILAAILASSLACDARSISRRYNAPEISGLRGFRYFVNSEVKGLLLISFIAVAPLLGFATLHSTEINTVLLYAGGAVVAAILLGLLAGSIFVPAKGEVGAQFLAGTLAAASVLLMPRILRFASLSLRLQAINWLCVAGICFLCTLIIEEARRKNYGHA